VNRPFPIPIFHLRPAGSSGLFFAGSPLSTTPHLSLRWVPSFLEGRRGCPVGRGPRVFFFFAISHFLFSGSGSLAPTFASLPILQDRHKYTRFVRFSSQSECFFSFLNASFPPLLSAAVRTFFRWFFLRAQGLESPSCFASFFFFLLLPGGGLFLFQVSVSRSIFLWQEGALDLAAGGRIWRRADV